MNYIDVIIIFALGYALYHGYRRGLLVGLLGLLVTLGATSLAILLFPWGSGVLTRLLSVNVALAPIVAFLTILLFFEVFGNIAIALIDRYLIAFVYRLHVAAMIDRILGTIPSFVAAALLITLVMLLPVTIPLSKSLRDDIQGSWWGSHVLPKAYQTIPKFEQLANRLPTQSLLYLLPHSPSSDESVALHLPDHVTTQVDEADEVIMLALLNKERTSRGLPALKLDKSIVPIARAHSKDMFDRNYFSHEDPDGKSPFDRMAEGGVQFGEAGENLAYAPTVAIAHDGLMRSKGHRENILHPTFTRIGIGVIDGGIYGKMFTQNFAN